MMPDPYDRHSRSRWEWGNPGARSQERAAAAREPSVKRPPGKKDPDLCKGRHWRGPHTPEVTLNANGWVASRKKLCGWAVYWRDHKPYWSCRHVLLCTGCGKDFGSCLPAQCPLWHEITLEEQAFLDAEMIRQDERMAAWGRRRKPVINGKQGYRKKR
jgi:hypothetical protein